MRLIERLHARYVDGRRVERLGSELAPLLPPGADVVDVGCGDGRLTRRLAELRPDCRFVGLDIQARPEAAVSVQIFDGRRLPLDDRSRDAVLLVDVVHHAENPLALVADAARVARRTVVIKDHLCDRPLSGPVLRFMDRVGNRRHGVALPFNYWSRRQWSDAFRRVGWYPTVWLERLKLYPIGLDALFGRGLHFIASLAPSETAPPIHGPAEAHPGPQDARWEDAYRRFETPEQEVRKFTRRLSALGAAAWPRSARIVEICCGRGNGLVALERLGFERLEGVDLSPRLLAEYRGRAAVYVGDCRQLPFGSASRDVVIVQGGLHHLTRWPEDLDRTLDEVSRILAAGGRFVAVEPWDGPFLRTVHTACRLTPIRRLWPRLDALATMIAGEAETYHAWLSRPAEILARIERRFAPTLSRAGWGKLMFCGVKRASEAED
jgi:SAM-dependent methyltransferase